MVVFERARNQTNTYAMIRAGIAIGTLAIFFFIACQKKDSTPAETSSVTSSNSITISGPLSYGDSIFYPTFTGPTKMVFPISKPADSGFFASDIPGIELDSATGKINLAKSESGLRYKVYYVSLLNYQPIDSTSITISGIDYKDAIYDISGADTLALPVYNMSDSIVLPANSEFDETYINTDTIEDIPGANRNKLIVNRIDGTINLKESFEAGVFGLLFSNGKKKDITFLYRLNDGSNRVLNKITIRLVYFQSRAFIPESMSLEINSRNDRYQVLAGTQTDSGSLLYYTTYTSTPKRPPLIVIVSSK